MLSHKSTTYHITYKFKLIKYTVMFKIPGRPRGSPRRPSEGGQGRPNVYGKTPLQFLSSHINLSPFKKSVSIISLKYPLKTFTFIQATEKNSQQHFDFCAVPPTSKIPSYSRKKRFSAILKLF